VVVGLGTLVLVTTAGIWWTRSRLSVEAEPQETAAPSASATALSATSPAPGPEPSRSTADPATAIASAAAGGSAAASATPTVSATASAAATVSATASAAPTAASTPPEEPAKVDDEGGDGADLPSDAGLLRVSFAGPPEAQVYWRGKAVGAVGRKLKVPCGLAFVRVGKTPGPEWLSKGKSVAIKCQAVTDVTLEAR